MNLQLNNQAGQIDNLLNELVDKLLPLAELTDEQEEEIRSDIEEVIEDMKGFMPEIGATSRVGMLTDRGIEGYAYNWGKFRSIDGSKPLGLLEHVGGNPLLGVVSRSTMSMSDYNMLAKWATVAYGYFEQYVVPQIPEGDRENVDQLIEAALPLIARMDKANRRMLIPALADGQSALVIDAKLQSKQFHAALPAMDEPMPMIEPAVAGVSDAKLLKKVSANIVKSPTISSMQSPAWTTWKCPVEIKIPEPETAETSLGTFYTFPGLDKTGLDAQIVPTIAISDNTAVLCMSKAQAERILTANPAPRSAESSKTWKILGNGHVVRLGRFRRRRFALGRFRHRSNRGREGDRRRTENDDRRTSSRAGCAKSVEEHHP